MSELHALLNESVDVDASIDDGPSPSDTVTTADRWTRRTGERLAGEWAQLGIAGNMNEDAPFVAADAVETLLSTAPTLAAHPVNAHRARWWQQLLESTELSALRAQTMLAPALAELAAAEIARQWDAYVASNPEPERRDGDSDAAGGDAGDESPEATVARIRSTRAAVEAAQDAAEQGRSVTGGLGLGADGGSVDARRLAALTRRLRQSRVLTRIMQLAGRYIARAYALQRQRVDLPGLEVTGVELSGDIARMLPLEAAFVAGAVPEIEILALYRLALRRSMSYRRERREPVGAGPIVVSVDESGSMSGEKIAAAKGLALAMAAIARAQKRPLLLAGYSGSDRIRVAHDSPDEIVAWCEQFLGGGSNCDLPFKSVQPHWPVGNIGAHSDHIIVSDAIVHPPQAFIDDYIAWAKRMNVRTFAIVIGARHAGALATVADGGCWCVPSLELDSAAVETLLSIGPTATRRVA